MNEDTVTIGEFISNYDKNEYEIFDEETNEWVNYNQSSYAKSFGFPKPDQAKYPINSITVQDYYLDVFYVFAFQDYKVKDHRVKYIQCNDEYDLCEKFLNFFRRSRPDVITGFNTEGFDIPYIINRFKQILPKGEYYKLSPVDEIKPIQYKGEIVGYNIIGIAHLDFLKIYKQMNLKKLETYSLESIAQEELGEGKIDFRKQGYKNHYDLYNRNFDLFIDYNIVDVELVSRINKKKRFIEIVLSQAYMAKVNIEDALGSVKPWDIYIYNELKKEGILPSPKINSFHTDIPGGYVKEPIPGIHEWLIVADIASSYPNNIISANLSPETHVDRNNLPKELLEIQDEVKKQFWGNKDEESTGYIDIDDMEDVTELLKKHNLCMSPNGEFFRSDIIGIFPKIVSKVYQGRKNKKHEMKKYWNEMKKYPKDSREYKDFESKWAAADNEQYALKIFLNSGYGVFANQYFRYNTPHISSAVTTGGQSVIKGPAKYIEAKLPNVKIQYIDTDSIFIDVSNILKDRFKEKYDKISMKEKREFSIAIYKKVIDKIIKEFYQNYTSTLNFPQNTFNMDFEVISDKTLFIGKKRYIMNLVFDDGDFYTEDNTKLKIKGVEINRTNTPMVVREKLKEIVKLIINTQDNDLCLKIVNNFRKEFFKMIFEKISKPTGVKGIDEYTLGQKSIPIHVRASKIYNKALKDLNLNTLTPIMSGDKIHFCYIKEPNIFNSNVIACSEELPKEISNKIQIDYETQFEKVFMSPVKIMFKALNWQTEKRVNLESFF